jgi:hypothetical protein
MRLLYPMRIHEVPEVIGKLPDRKWSIAPRRFTVPAGVQSIYKEMLSKHLCLPHEIITVLTVPMQQDQRLSLTFLYEMVLDAHVDKFLYVEFQIN